MKKGGKGKKMVVEQVPFGGDDAFPSLGNQKKEERKVISTAKPIQVDDSILSPEGASIRDLCTYNESCQNESCKSYHPKWAEGLCIPFALGKCGFNNCFKQHLQWLDLIALSIPKEQFDIFYNKPFKGGAAQKQPQPIPVPIQPQQQSMVNTSRKVVDLAKKEESKIIPQAAQSLDFSEILKQEESKKKPVSVPKQQQAPPIIRQVVNQEEESKEIEPKQEEEEVIEKKSDSSVVQIWASKLGTKSYFSGDTLNEQDEKAFTSLLSIGEATVESNGSKNLKRWFQEMKESQAEEIGQCSYCEKRMNVALYKIKIATSVSEDLVLSCPACSVHHANMRRYELLLEDSKYIKGNILEETEVKLYHKELEQLEHLIEKYQKTFPKLNAYMKMMKFLTKEETILCLGCGKKFDIMRFENLLFGVKAETNFCVPCYDKTLRTIVSSGMQLGNQKLFFQDSWGQEVQLCKKLKPYKEYLKYTVYTNLVTWFEMISDVLDNPIVKCECCPKEFKNHTGARFSKDDFSCYACSSQCRAKLHEKERREKQKQKKAQLIDARFQISQNSQSKPEEIQANDSDFDDKIQEWINNQPDKFFLSNFEINAVRLLKRFPQIEDVSVIFKMLKKHQNDAFHAMCEIEAQRPFNYIEMRYLSQVDDSRFIKV